MNVDKRWWAEAMNTAVFITNRLPCAAYPKKPPFELLFGQKPDISEMQREGIPCMGYQLGTCDVFDERPHSKYIQVRMDNAEKNHQRDDDDDDDCEITPVYNADIQETSDMKIDSVGRQQDYQGPSSQLAHSDIGANRTDPLFEIDDVFMNEDTDDEDRNSSQALVRHQHDESIKNSRSIIQHPTSSNSFSNAIVPVQYLSNKITPEENGRVPKRLRIVYEQACTAYKIPTSYDDALKSPQETKMENRPYRSLVGSLLYVATGTRPDIAFTVCQLSRHLEQPCEEQWKAAIRVLKYLKSTKSTGICYTRISQNITIEAYSDADWPVS
ncbi:hypothetical protein PsorP6_017633 [Peronosclerospora sorghi]|uniref:Uncharacterized protein n=1 Tax=Peronosclerospora sorghi TaxID=230839 RepID=A0ACC0WKE2_9STRA|nr:hypothetical protein PsorP6_017633 [Peronosclerospora sorghi]